MVTENSFRNLLRQQVGATRAGKFGEFSIGFNMSGGFFDDNVSISVPPGQTYKFQAQESSGNVMTVEVTNDTTPGAVGIQAFQAQAVDPSSTTIVVGTSPGTGKATLVFTGPNGLDFTTVASQTRGGQTPAIVAVKFRNDQIVGFRLNNFAEGTEPLDQSATVVTADIGGANLNLSGGAWGVTERL